VSDTLKATRALWSGPRWTLAMLLAAMGTLGPFSIDTYLPAFVPMAASLDASPLQMQQTLSAYLFGFAFMQLFHGALSDSLGRKRVALAGIAVFTVASIGCALTTDVTLLIALRALQGMSTGAGIVVSRTVIRDMFDPVQAQKMMSQVTLFFGVAPALAPMVGGLLVSALNWQSIFWFLALVGVLLWFFTWRLLPETLPVERRQPLNMRNLFRGYRQIGSSRKFWLLSLASGVPFNGMFIYILASPTFLGVHLKVQPTQFFWLFCATIGGIMLGAFVSGRLAGKLPVMRQVRRGFRIMAAITVVNLLYNVFFTPVFAIAVWPIGLFAFGWALITPAITLMVLDMFADRRGMASSLQICVSSAFNGLTAGVLAPIAMQSTLGLAIGSAALFTVGLAAWLLYRRLDSAPVAAQATSA
jgi:MFS transporter, DHA1 family, multidrug resistance protein